MADIKKKSGGRFADHVGQLAVGVTVAIVGGIIGWFGNRLATREPSLTAEIRYGREPNPDPAKPDSGFYDIRLRNEGDKQAKAVRLVVPNAESVVTPKSPGRAPESRPVVNEMIEIGDMMVGEMLNLFVRVNTYPPTIDDAERIRLTQEDGKSSITIMEWVEKSKALPSRLLEILAMTALAFAVVLTLHRLTARTGEMLQSSDTINEAVSSLSREVQKRLQQTWSERKPPTEGGSR